MRKLFSLVLALFLLTACQPVSQELVVPEHNSIFYEIYVGSFADSNDDGIGDLNGVRAKLDYIRSLGATGIWLMPISPSNTYHKYDVIDYMGIAEDYGTMEDFDGLIADMKAKDMDLLLDLVVNHTSSSHPWFKAAINAKISGTCATTPECDYYNFSDTFEAGYTKVTSDIWYESVFWSEMPDLNLDSPAVREEVSRIIAFWLDKGVKGFRLDATTHFYGENLEKNIAFLTWLNDTIKEVNPDAYVVGEAWTTGAVIAQMYSSGIDGFFNFPMSQNSGAIYLAINGANGRELAKRISDYNEMIKSFNENALDAVFLSNHDNNRSAGYLSTLERQRLAAAIYLLMPGNVFIYYGEEVAMIGSGKDENKRLPMPWGKDSEFMTDGPKDADYSKEQPTDVASALKDKDSLLNFYMKLGALRNSYPSISRGAIRPLDLGQPALYAMDHGDLIVIHNLSEETLQFEQDFSQLIDINGASGKGKTVSLEAYGSVLLIK